MSNGSAEGSEDFPFLEDFLEDIVEVGWPNKWKNIAGFCGDIAGFTASSFDCFSWTTNIPATYNITICGTWVRSGVVNTGDPLWLLGGNRVSVLEPAGRDRILPLIEAHGVVLRSVRYGNDVPQKIDVGTTSGVYALIPYVGNQATKKGKQTPKSASQKAAENRIYAITGNTTWSSSPDALAWGGGSGLPPAPPGGHQQRTFNWQISAKFANGVDRFGRGVQIRIDYSPFDFIFGLTGFQVTRFEGPFPPKKKTGTEIRAQVSTALVVPLPGTPIIFGAQGYTSSIVPLPWLPICVASDGKQHFVIGAWGQGDINNFSYPGGVLVSNDAGLTWGGQNHVTPLPIVAIAAGPRPKDDANLGVQGTANPRGPPIAPV
jgi:hypothetical protein